MPRKPDEAYTYLRVAIISSEPRSVTSIDRTMKPIVGLDADPDYGNIDSFTWRGDRYELVGEWGHVVIDADAPSVIELA